MFDYMTAQEAAEKWEVSLRWVQRLCKENRIEGALNINRVWLIPKKALKPADGRYKNAEEIERVDFMNKIYWDKDIIARLTNQIDSVPHKHWAIQLFLSLEKDLEILVSEDVVKCKCVIVNENVNHSFRTGNQVCFSIIIVPTSNTAEQLKKLLNGSEYFIIQMPDISEIQSIAFKLKKNDDLELYYNLINRLYFRLGLNNQNIEYDDRIVELLKYIEQCDCYSHSISTFADKVCLSQSRLSHLFREQVGMPLKSYIQFHQMQKAFLALLNGKSITEAAMIAHFDTPSHFAAVTKRMMGMPASVSLKNSVFLKVSNI